MTNLDLWMIQQVVDQHERVPSGHKERNVEGIARLVEGDVQGRIQARVECVGIGQRRAEEGYVRVCH
jgi:hypothetical protein